jgi:signal transduction histidine kinase
LKNFDVFTAENGVIGVQIAKQEQPDLILCDVMMPELDGFGVLKTLRQNSLTATIPIIFLTARAAREDVREGMDLGADDYLSKPFSAPQLLRTISARIEKQEAINKESSEKLDILRRNIAAFLPHELLTPLHGIMGISDLILNYHESMSPSELVDSIRGIQDSSQRLSRLVRNFIMFSELEAIASGLQSLRDSSEPIDVEVIIGFTAQTHAAKVNRSQDLELDLDDALIKISSHHLTKAVEEIVGNAFKFSLEGTPVRLFSKIDKQFFRLYIVDRGRGMTTEQIANIGAYMQFERKYYEQQGNGLGLIISKRIVELYGGELSVESIIGKQTSVCIKFPL